MACSLNFNIAATSITKASRINAADGSFSVVLNDPNSTNYIQVRVGSDPPYGSVLTRYSNGETVTFTGFAPGTYTVYARNSTDCLATLQVTVGYEYYYQPRHRILFQKEYQTAYDLANPTYKLDIEDAEYTGDPIEEKAGDTPVVLSYNNEANQDPFSPVISSKLDVTLISQTDGYFEHLYTYDERRFRASLYEYDGVDYVLIWRGYIVPMLFKEQYWIDFNYEVTFTFTDGIADLKEKPFSDSSGNYPKTRISIFDTILFCLQKTGIELDIWDAVVIINTNLETDTEYGTLKQVYVDLDLYRDSGTPTCGDILESILKNLKARVYQAEGVWHIESISQKPATSINTRVYLFDGTLFGSGALQQRILLRRATALGEKISLRDRSGMIETVQRYGQYNLTYDLSIEQINNVLEAGEFEDEDLENGQLKGWAVSTQDVYEGNYSYGLEKIVREGDSKSAFFVQYNNYAFASATQNQKVILTSAPFSLQYPDSGPFLLRLRFDVFTRPLYTGPYIYFDFSIQEYFASSGNPYILQAREIHKDANGYSLVKQLSIDMVDNKYLRIYIDDHLTWKTVEVDILINEAPQATAYELAFRFSSNPIYDVSTITTFKTISTTGQGVKTYDNRYRVLDGTFIRWYSLEAGNDAESLPDIVRPNDYGSGGVFFVWKLKETYAIPTVTDDIGITLGIADWLQSMLLDNVRIEYFPEKQEPIQEIISSLSINDRISPTLDETVLHGDIEVDNGMDANYFLISRGILTDSGGEPLYGGWKLRGADGDGFYLTKLLGDLVKDFYNEKRILLTGTTDTRDKRPSFYNSIYEVRTGRVFINSSLSVDFKNMTAQHELIEMLKGEPIIDEGDPPLPGDPGGPDPIEPPVSIREHTNEFSNEFA